MDSMKFCPVCGVLVSVDKQEYRSQPEQSEFAAVYTPPKLPELNIKTPRKLVAAAFAFVVFAVFASAGGNDEESSTSSTSDSSTSIQTFAEIWQSDYKPVQQDLSDKVFELSDYAFAGDVDSLTLGCIELKAIAEKGLSLQGTTNPGFDQAWKDTMKAGVNASDSCVDGDYEQSTEYLNQMSALTETLTSYIK
jgi:hypothetical protein